MLLRSLTGPFDLKQSGVPSPLGAILPAAPIKLDSLALDFFAQRVADGAKNATVSVDVRIGTDCLRIVRHLKNLKLLALVVNGTAVALHRTMDKREPTFKGSSLRT